MRGAGRGKQRPPRTDASSPRTHPHSPALVHGMALLRPSEPALCSPLRLPSLLASPLRAMSWYPLPVAKFATDVGKTAPSTAMPFGMLPPTLAQTMLNAPTDATGAAHTAGGKRPFDATPQTVGASAPPAAYASKFARSSEDASGPRGGGGLGRGRRRGGMRGGMRGGQSSRDADPPASVPAAAAAAVVPHTPGFLADGRPDLSMYLTQTQTHTAAATPSPSRAPPPAYAAAAAASSAAADGSAAAAPAANKPIYCQTYMQNLCFLRSCDAKDDDTEAAGAASAADPTSAAAAPAPVGRCEFVHDPEFRRTYLARNQWRATTWSQNRKSDTLQPNNRRHAPPRSGDDDAPPKDGKLSGLKAPVKEDALLRKLLVSELRVESSRVLQAIRFLVTRDCLAKERNEIRQKQQEAEEQHRRSKLREAEEEAREKEEQERQRQQSSGQVHSEAVPSSAVS